MCNHTRNIPETIAFKLCLSCMFQIKLLLFLVFHERMAAQVKQDWKGGGPNDIKPSPTMGSVPVQFITLLSSDPGFFPMLLKYVS